MLQEGGHIQSRAPHHHRQLSTAVDVPDDPAGSVHIIRHAEGLLRGEKADQMMGYCCKLLRSRLGGGNVHTPIDLHGVGGHDLSAVCLCQGDAQGCLAGCGRANHRQNRYFFLLHGRLPTPV